MREESSLWRSRARTRVEFLSRFRLELVREPDPRFPTKDKAEVAEVAAIAHRILAGFDREAVGAVYLSGRGNPFGYVIAYVGTLNKTAVEPRGLIVPGLLANAAQLIAFHNHPSGNTEPSSDDLMFTRQLGEAAAVVGLSLKDHLILGERPDFLSMRERGLL